MTHHLRSNRHRHSGSHNAITATALSIVPNGPHISTMAPPSRKRSRAAAAVLFLSAQGRALSFPTSAAATRGAFSAKLARKLPVRFDLTKLACPSPVQAARPLMYRKVGGGCSVLVYIYRFRGGALRTRAGFFWDMFTVGGRVEVRSTAAAYEQQVRCRRPPVPPPAPPVPVAPSPVKVEQSRLLPAAWCGRVRRDLIMQFSSIHFIVRSLHAAMRWSPFLSS